MSDLGWRADGIQRARAAGGVELEVYRRPGFQAASGVRRSEVGASGFAVWQDSIEADPEPDEYDRKQWRRRR